MLSDRADRSRAWPRPASRPHAVSPSPCAPRFTYILYATARHQTKKPRPFGRGFFLLPPSELSRVACHLIWVDYQCFVLPDRADRSRAWPRPASRPHAVSPSPCAPRFTYILYATARHQTRKPRPFGRGFFFATYQSILTNLIVN